MTDRKPIIEAALQIIARRRLSVKQLISKMVSKGYSKEEIEKCIEYLIESNYLNDDELLDDYLLTLIGKKKYGPERVVTFLSNKGFERSQIRERIEKLFTKDDIVQNGISLVVKKFGDSFQIDDKEIRENKEIREKVVRTLAYNGYDWDLIERIINR